MIRGIAAAATHPAAAEAARAALDAGGSAVDAVIAGFLGAAGADAAALLAPAIAIVAGTGVGARAFDGRAAQPGRGAPRPRGFVGDAEIPDGARVAAPRSVATLALLHAYRGRLGLRDLARAGVATAEREGATARARLLKKVGVSGILALRSPEAHRALLAVGGPVAGGILTAEDIDEALPVELEAASTDRGEAVRVFTAPFAPPDGGAAIAEAIVACDARGGLAALVYAPDRGGIAVPSLELTIGREAVPVRRGVTRVAPGTPLAAPAPVAIVTRTGFAAAVAAPGSAAIDVTAIDALASGVAVETALAAIAAKGRAPVAVVTDGRDARAASVTASTT